MKHRAQLSCLPHRQTQPDSECSAWLPWLAACGSLSLALAEPWIIDRVATLRGQYLREPIIDSNALRTCPHSIEVYVEEPPLDWRHEVNVVVIILCNTLKIKRLSVTQCGQLRSLRSVRCEV